MASLEQAPTNMDAIPAYFATSQRNLQKFDSSPKDLAKYLPPRTTANFDFDDVMLSDHPPLGIELDRIPQVGSSQGHGTYTDSLEPVFTPSTGTGTLDGSSTVEASNHEGHRNRISPAQWQRVKNRVIELYNDHTLPEVTKTIEKEFDGFKASQKAFKDHLRLWNANNKNLRLADVQDAIRQCEARDSEGKRSTVIVRRRQFPQEKIDRYVARKSAKLRTSKDKSSKCIRRPQTPTVIVVTPPSSPRPMPLRSTISFEKVLHGLKAYILFALGPEKLPSPGPLPFAPLQVSAITLPHSLAHSHRSVYLVQTIDSSRAAITDASIWNIQSLIVGTNYLLQVFPRNVAMDTIQYMRKTTIALLGDNNYLSAYLDHVACIPEAESTHLASSAEQLLVDQAEDSDPTSFPYIMRKLSRMRRRAGSRALAVAEESLASFRSNHPPHDLRVLCSLICLGNAFYDEEDYANASEAFAECISLSDCFDGDSTDRIRLLSEAYLDLAWSQYQLQEVVSACNNLWDSIRTMVFVNDNLTRKLLLTRVDTLRAWQTDFGVLDHAEELKRVADILSQRCGRVKESIRCQDGCCREKVYC